jgi:cell division transport system ATP-binding protein
MIRMFHIFKNFGSNSALKDINLTIDEGEFVFVTGPSGAGKTTLLRLVFGAEKPTAGNILVGGVNLNRISRPKLDLLRRNMGFVFQDFKLLSNKTVFQNVALALEVTGESKKNTQKKTHQTLKQVGLANKEKSLPLQLSGGEQQRVAIARAIVRGPLILLADEPTGNLDPNLTAEIMDLLTRIHKKGTTVIIATHSREILTRMDQRTIFLNHGIIIDKI